MPAATTPRTSSRTPSSSCGVASTTCRVPSDALAAVQAYARSKNAATVLCVGNHDERSAFQAVLGTGHHNKAGSAAGQLLVPDRCAAVSELDGLRIITLDSLVPGQVHGHISDEQIRVLTDLLRQPAPRGSIVVLHHPPIALDSEFWRGVNLHHAEALMAALPGSDVRAVLCGHNHLQLCGTIAGIPIWVTPGVITRIDLTASPSLERAVSGAAATLVDLDAASGPLFTLLHARDPHAGRQLYLVNAMTGTDVAQE